jgi:hydroxymethylglutaryl-CoA lyase
MGFGNPYGDPWDVEIVRLDWKVIKMGVKILSLSDTVGILPWRNQLFVLQFDSTIPRNWVWSSFHTTPDKWFEKIDAYHAGCRRFWRYSGIWGCPMAKDDLTEICQQKSYFLFYCQ